MFKILEAICNAFDERIGVLYGNMEVRNAILQALRLSKMYTILNSQVWGRDYITGQRTVQKLGKQIDEIDEFICNHFLDLLPLQNLNVMHTSVL